MKVRGTLKVTKDIIAPKTGNSTAAADLYGKTDANGTLKWADLSVPTVDVNKDYTRSSLVLDSGGNAFISLRENASGSSITDPGVWAPFGGSGNSGNACDCLTTIQIGPYPPNTYTLEEIVLMLHFLLI